MVAYYSGDFVSAVRWDHLPEDSVVGEQRLFSLVVELDLARARRVTGNTQQAAVLLAGLHRRLAPMLDPGQFPAWVAAEEQALSAAGANETGGAEAAGTAEPARARSFVPGSQVGDTLSPREIQVLRLLRSEFTLPEIESHLFISHNTAKTHRRTIYQARSHVPVSRCRTRSHPGLSVRRLITLRLTA